MKLVQVNSCKQEICETETAASTGYEYRRAPAGARTDAARRVARPPGRCAFTAGGDPALAREGPGRIGSATPPRARAAKAARKQPAWRNRGTACARPWVQ